MNSKSIAPCGLICDLCSGFQREKNRCDRCNGTGNKPQYCIDCKIKTCSEKKRNDKQLCNKCTRFPCTLIKKLDKRYTTRYGESNIQNLLLIDQIGKKSFIEQEKKRWVCTECGKFLCVHKERCLHCGSVNKLYPLPKKILK